MWHCPGQNDVIVVVVLMLRPAANDNYDERRVDIQSGRLAPA